MAGKGESGLENPEGVWPCGHGALIPSTLNESDLA